MHKGLSKKCDLELAAEWKVKHVLVLLEPLKDSDVCFSLRRFVCVCVCAYFWVH